MMLSSIFGSKGAFKSLTFWGVAGTLASTLVGHYDPSLVPTNVATGLQIAGTAIAVLGLRRAHSKTVSEIADLISQLAEKKK
jgi:hypothetical protein